MGARILICCVFCSVVLVGYGLWLQSQAQTVFNKNVATSDAHSLQPPVQLASTPTDVVLDKGREPETRLVATAAEAIPTAKNAAHIPSPANDSPDAVRQLAREIYIWGWPLAYLHHCKTALERLPAAGLSSGMPVAPPNQICMLTDYIEPTSSAVPCPNQDVIYGFGLFDLMSEPVVLQVPDFGDRYWLFQLGDQRTDSFADMGIMYASSPGCYLIVGPNWDGAVPPGIVKVLPCTTQLAYCLPRIYYDGTAEDRDAIAPLLNQIVAYPVSRYTGAMRHRDWSRVKWYPPILSNQGVQAKRVQPERFFSILPSLLTEVPPLAEEESLYSSIRQLIIKMSSNIELKSKVFDEWRKTEAECIAAMFGFQKLGHGVGHGWTTIVNGAAFGTDYWTRAAVAKSNIFVNRHQETKYYYLDNDCQGDRLDGSHRYRIHFSPGGLPPARAFWSLTVYDELHSLVKNAIDRHAIGSKDKGLYFELDGSLTIAIQHDPPTDVPETNWLPAPHGPFSLYLRAYWPEPVMLDGRWQPPAVYAEETK